MICFKGCKKEIEMLNELLSKAIEEKNTVEQQLHESLVQVNKATDTLKAGNNRIKELESALLRFENINKPPQPVKGIGTYYNDPVSGEPLFRSIDDDKVSNNLSGAPKPNWELPKKPKDCNDKWKGTVHTVTDLGTCYNEPVTGEPLFSSDFVGEVPSTSKYPAKKKK